MRMPSVKRLVSELNLSNTDASLIRRIGRSVDTVENLHRALKSDERLRWLADDVLCNHSSMNTGWRRTYALRAMDLILGTHGVEALAPSNDWHNGYGGPPWEYLNAGDAYAATLIYTTATDTIRIACWGDIAERFPSRE